MNRLTFTLLIASFACLQSVVAQDAPGKTDIKATDAEINKLIDQLENGKFLDRKKATEGLIKIGAAAVPAVAKGAESPVVEVRGRSMEILKELYNGKDATAKKAATEALQKIADGKNELNAIRAKQILRPVGPANVAPNNPLGIRVAVAGATKIAVREVNGVKHIDAEEKGTKYKIVHDPKKSITVEITKKDANGKATTKKYEAKDPADLKKKHPEAYKAFDKYSKPLNVARINIGFGAVRPAPRQRVLPIGVKAEDLDKVNKHLEGLIKRLGDAAGKGKIDEVKKITEELKQVQETVKKIRADADKGIEGRMRKSMEARGLKIP